MNRWQMTRQIVHALRQLTWSNGELVFSQVVATAGLPDIDEAEALLRLPHAAVRPVDVTARPESRELLTGRWDVAIVARNEVSDLGEAALLGAARVSGIAGQSGRGVLELEEQALIALEDVNQTGGFQLRLMSMSAPGAALGRETGYTVGEALRFEGHITSRRNYAPPTGLRLTQAAGVVTATWDAFPDRWDRHEFVLRRGGSPNGEAPLGPTGGVAVTLASLLATSATNTPPSTGSWGYALFCGYDDLRVLGSASTSSTSFSSRIALAVTVT